MKHLLLLLICLLPLQSFSQDWRTRDSLPISDCSSHVPFGMPSIVKSDTTMICRKGYLLQHDNRARIPIWVSYHLSKEKVSGCAARTSSFRQDPALPKDASASARDFARSGFDIGHMAPNADMRWSKIAEEDSNFFSNTAPQEPDLNRRAWRVLEEYVRNWAAERNEIIIHVGPIYNHYAGERLNGRVIIPLAFFKIIIDPATKEILAFLYENRPTNDRVSADFFISSVPEIESRSHLSFALPKDFIFSTSLWVMSESARIERAKTCATE